MAADERSLVEATDRVRRGHALTEEEIGAAMEVIVSGRATSEDVAGFLTVLNAKGFTVAEIAGAARVLRRHCLKVPTRHDVLVDTCGTGGDGKGTFNISTAAALVAAAAGLPVAKHGNRSVSSRCGSADVLESLGVRLDLTPERLGACLDTVGIAFLFAQRLHPAMRHVAPVRRALGVKTIFNVLGPLANPAPVTHQVVGVYDRNLLEPMARVLGRLGLRRALVVHGSDGSDEVTLTGPTWVCEWREGEGHLWTIDPTSLGLECVPPRDLEGGGPEENAGIIREILAGKPGPPRDVVRLNAACVLYVAGRVGGLAEGMQIASAVLDAGLAARRLEELRAFTAAGEGGG